MEKLHHHEILFPLFLLLQFSSLLLLSSSYTLPDKYFINCGSDSNATVAGRIFVGDTNSGSYSPPGQSSSLKATNASTDTSPLYQTARIFKDPSSYELNISENGMYVLRLHFQAFPSPVNLSDALFNVTTSNFLLLSNFRVPNSSNSPLIKEFLLTINVRKFKIHFTPSQETSLAFVNAMEVFLAPESFIPSNASHVTPAGSNGTYNGLLSHLVLYPVHRINVGGHTITPEEDTLWRSWIPDDAFLYYQGVAGNCASIEVVYYQAGGATNYTAPHLVYRTSKYSSQDFYHITWRFAVSKNARHFVRVHFCDIISSSFNVLRFNLYIYSSFSRMVSLNELNGFYFAVPFYYDFVVDSDSSGFMNISIGPRENSWNKTAYLNGLEIMELMGWDAPMQSEQNKKRLFVIVGSVVGGVAVICILLAVVFFGLKRRKAKPVETLGSHLRLKVPFSEIWYATKKFNKKLVIGEGGFGKVYKGTLTNGTKVAVKRSEPGHDQGLQEFKREIEVLSKIRHRNLVSLIGYCDERSEMILVYEFMEKGTLRDHLYGDSEGSSSRSELSWEQRLQICIDSATGLDYLHTGSVGGTIHRDVKSTNILLDQDYRAKVADFGLSKSGYLDQTQGTTGVKGSFGYLDPEYFKCLLLTEKSDVYSFGVVLLEVLCARPALDISLPREQVNLAEWGMSWQKKGQLEKIIDPFLVGKINTNSFRKFGEITEMCLKEHGVDRPSMDEVLYDLKFTLLLQQTAVHRKPYEDSTVVPSVELPLPVVQSLPSHSVPVEEEDQPTVMDGCSFTTASEVFSQLRTCDAR